MSVKQIANLIADDLERVEEAIVEHLESDVELYFRSRAAMSCPAAVNVFAQ